MLHHTTKSVCDRRGCTARAARQGYCATDARWAEKVGKLEPLERVDDVTELRRRLLLLRDRYGWSTVAIGQRTRTTHAPINRVLSGKSKRPLRSLHDAVMAIPLTVCPTSSLLVDPTGTRRRVDGLRWLGYPLAWIADQCAVTDTALKIALASGKVSARLHAAVAAVYHRHSGSLGPSQHARTVARRDGLLPPAVWDDRTIDNPKAQPRGLRPEYEENAA